MKITAKQKYHYLERYWNGESPTRLGLEINANSTQSKSIVLRWNRIFQARGMMGLEDNRGKNSKGRTPKKRINYEELDKETLIKIIKIKDELLNTLEKKQRARFRYPLVKVITRKYKLSIEQALTILEVSRSGYYKWLKNPITSSSYNAEWLMIVKNEFNKFNGTYGTERLWMELKQKNLLNVNIKTVKRYLRAQGLIAKIRIPKAKREIKDVKDKRINYIKNNFKNDSARAKIFTDTTEFNTPNGKYYFSAVVNANGSLLGLDVSRSNDTALISKNIKSSVKKLGQKYIIHSDNAAFYKTNAMREFNKLNGGLQSFTAGGKPLENRPIEYFFSILKQEYLRIHRASNLEEYNSLVIKIMFDYNFKRIQKNLKWKTPAKARV